MILNDGGGARAWDDSARAGEAVCCLSPLGAPHKVRFIVDRDANEGFGHAQLVNGQGNTLDHHGALDFISRFLRVNATRRLVGARAFGWDDWSAVEAEPVSALQRLTDYILDDGMIR